MVNMVKTIAEKYADTIWNQKDLQVIDQLLHPEIVIHSLFGKYQGRQAMRDVVQAWLKAFPDLAVTTLSTLTEVDKVMIQWKAQGTHQGAFKGIQPTGKPVHYEGVTIYRIQDQQIIEYWAYLDMQYLFHQIR